MPKNPKPSTRVVLTPELDVPKGLLDQWVSGPMTQGDPERMFRSLKKAVIERAMKAGMGEHLGYETGESKPAGQSNQRNGASGKTVITDEGRPFPRRKRAWQCSNGSTAGTNSHRRHPSTSKETPRSTTA